MFAKDKKRGRARLILTFDSSHVYETPESMHFFGCVSGNGFQMRARSDRSADERGSKTLSCTAESGVGRGAGSLVVLRLRLLPGRFRSRARCCRSFIFRYAGRCRFLRRLHDHLHFTFLEEFQEYGLAPISQPALVPFDDPRVAPRPVLEAGSNFPEKFVDD